MIAEIFKLRRTFPAGFFFSAHPSYFAFPTRNARASFDLVMVTVEGIYKNGKVELIETPARIDQSRVLVTFLGNNEVDLQSRGISETQAADLRARLKTFADDWNRPEDAIYDEPSPR